MCRTLFCKFNVDSGLMLCYVFGATAPQWARVSSFTKFLDHTQWHNTVGRTTLEEWSARRRDLYLTTHNTLNRQHIHAAGGIRTHNLRKRATADLRLSPHGHWNPPGVSLKRSKSKNKNKKQKRKKTTTKDMRIHFEAEIVWQDYKISARISIRYEAHI